MLSSIKKKFPLFMKDICNNFATLTHYGNEKYTVSLVILVLL